MQANRNAVNKVLKIASPTLDTIRDSDGPAQIASVAIALRQIRTPELPRVEMRIAKNRRGPVEDTVEYKADFDKGYFDYWTDNTPPEAELVVAPF